MFPTFQDGMTRSSPITTARYREGGANPPLPRNCKRREPGEDDRKATGTSPGKAAEVCRRVSQENGLAPPTRGGTHMFDLSIFRKTFGSPLLFLALLLALVLAPMTALG